MNRLLITVTVLLVLALFLFVSVHISDASLVQNDGSTSSPTNSTVSDMQAEYLAIDYDTLQNKIGMVARSSSISPVVTTELIMMIASKLPEHSLTQNVHYELVTMTFPNFNAFSPAALSKNQKLENAGYINDLPVWLVSFQGLNIPSMNKKEPVYNHETIYVIDASSGEMLLGFSYR